MFRGVPAAAPLWQWSLEWCPWSWEPTPEDRYASLLPYNKKWLEEHFNRLDPIVSHRMIKGKAVEDGEYLQNILTWKHLRAKTINSLRNVDALLVPTTAISALPVADFDANMDIYF
jgi:Asp-tRNA(Asn)/Glu-tRNA(Gln) amidotransferase A subunit family amidase